MNCVCVCVFQNSKDGMKKSHSRSFISNLKHKVRIKAIFFCLSPSLLFILSFSFSIFSAAESGLSYFLSSSCVCSLKCYINIYFLLSLLSEQCQQTNMLLSLFIVSVYITEFIHWLSTPVDLISDSHFIPQDHIWLYTRIMTALSSRGILIFRPLRKNLLNALFISISYIESCWCVIQHLNSKSM